MADDRLRDLHLDRFWDDLVRGDRASAGDGLDPEEAATVRAFQRLARAPLPARARTTDWRAVKARVDAQRQLEEDIMATVAQWQTIPPSIAGNGRYGPRGRPVSAVPGRRQIKWLSVQFATVLLLLVTLLFGYLAYRQSRPAAIPPAQETPTAVPAPTTESWPMYRGDPGRTGNLSVTGPTGTPAEAWRYQTQGRIDSVPIVVSGVLYVASEDANLYALDAKTGIVIWTAPLGAGSGSSPAFADGVVYIGDNNNDLHAIDAATGQERWKATGFGWVDPGPIVDGVLYAANADGTFQAIQASDGEDLWRTPLPQGASRAAGYADGQVFVGSGDGRVNALDAKTGELKWSYDLGTGTVGTVAVAGGVVYGSVFGGGANSFVALDSASGKQLWSFVTPTGADVRSPAIGNGMVFTVSGDGNVYALDAATGAQRWSAAAGSVVRAAPALVGDTLYVVANAGALLALDAATGTERWRFDYGSTSDYGPIAADGLLYLATNGGAVIAIGSSDEGTATGSSVTAPAAATGQPGSATSTAAASATTLAVGAATGDPVQFLYALTSGSTPFDQPTWMAIDPNGNLWVNNGPTSQFLIFAPDGSFLEAWGTPGTGDGQLDCSSPEGLNAACDIAFAPDGSFYVLEQGKRRVEKFDANRNFLFGWDGDGTEAGKFIYPFSFTLDAEGNIWVADQGSHSVQKFDGNGKFLLAFGSFGESQGKFRRLIIGDVDASGNIYVGDAELGPIQVFDRNGTYLATFGTQGVGSGQINGSSAPAIDAAGNVYVPDLNNARIDIFDATGRFVASWGTVGSGDGQFNVPGAVLLDGAGNAYVADVLNNRVQKFRLLPPLAPAATSATSAATPQPNGASRPTFAWATTGGDQQKLDTPLDVAVAPDGKIWVADVPGEFKIFDANGNYLETWGSSGSGPGQLLFTGEFGAGVFFTFAPDGSLYVADYGNFRVQHFDQNRKLVGTWGVNGTGDGQFLTATGIIVQSDGTVLVDDASRNDVQHFDANGTFLDRFDAATSPDGPLVAPVGIARDTRGRLIVVENGPPGRVRVFDAFGARVATLDITGQRPPSWNNDIDVAVDANGNIFVCDQNNGVIRVFGPDLSFRYQWGNTGEGDERLFNPGWMALGPDGAVYVTDDANGRLVRFDLAAQASATPVSFSNPVEFVA